MWRLFLRVFLHLILFGYILADLGNITNSSADNLPRVKRQYDYSYGYGGYDAYGWQVGRIIGWILGLLLCLLFLCVPCICCIGIWFAGWFGVRSLMSRRKSSSNQSAGTTTPRVRFVERDAAPPPPPETEHRVVYTQETDRYYRRETSPTPGGYYDRERDTRRY
uniref:Uncharacterized protein n=1 Tax=Acrobeloides nanus TaxID=290746 RepID=A0A914DPP8_9BILA